MSATPLFSSNRKSLRRFGPAGVWLVTSVAAWPQAVPSQANIDASAQRRLQETAREAQRQHRIEEQLRNVSPALFSEALAGPGGPALARKALAALLRLRQDGLPMDEALTRAARSSGIDPAAAAKPASYLRNLFIQKSGQITPTILAKLEAGKDPAPDLVLAPFAR